MRTASVKVLGEAHVLCLSTRAKIEIDEEFGGLDAAFDKLTGDDSRAILETTFGLLEILMRAGDVYARRTGLDNARPITAEDMLDLVGIDDLPELVDALRAAIVNGVRREVDVEEPDSKNAPATPS